MHKVIQSGIVVTSPQNNPSIMTHQFLTEYGIIPSDWKIKSSLETPQFSQVFWNNGLSITSDPGKIIFQFDLKNKDPKPFERECLLGDIAEKYIGQLSKVKYLGVGINFSSVFDEFKNIQEEFPKLFLSPKLARINNISPGQVKVSRKLNQNRTLNLTISFGKYQGPGKYNDIEKNLTCLLFRGNLHYDIVKSTIKDAWEELIEIIKSWETFYPPFEILVNEVIDNLKKD